MAATETLQKVISNFDLQARLYNKMAELAAAQLQTLKENSYSACLDEVNRILGERRLIINELAPLNSANKELQQAVIDELEIETFNFKNLKASIEPELFTQLKATVNKVQALLTLIDKADRESEQIMRRSAPGRSGGKAAQKKAVQAYNQAKKSND